MNRDNRDGTKWVRTFKEDFNKVHLQVKSEQLSIVVEDLVKKCYTNVKNMLYDFVITMY